jgi:hypothetical protein
MTRVLAVLIFLGSGSSLWAHDEKLSLSRVEVKDRELVWSVDVALQGLEKVLPLPAVAYDLSDRQLQELKPAIVQYLLRCLQVEINGVPVQAEPGTLEPLLETFVATGDKYIAHARQEFRFPSPGPIRRVTLSGAFFRTLTDRHQAVLDVSWDGAKRRFERVGPFDLELTPSRIHPTFGSTVSEFFLAGLRQGIRWDGVGFLLALLLGAKTAGELIRVVASFAAAHSLTLLLATLEVIRLPPMATGLLMAASIVYVAAENMVLSDGRHRWVLTFVFGLVHGLGFSAALRPRLEDLASTALPLTSFNAGVESGQIALLLVAFPVVARLRKGSDDADAARRQRHWARIGSIPILLLGLLLFVDRILEKGWLN